MRRLHEGICGVDLGSQTMANRVLKLGHYRPTLRIYFVEFVK